MRTFNKLTLVSAIVAGLSMGLGGCSSSSDSSSGSSNFTPYERVAALPTQEATITISDPLGAGDGPSISIESPEFFALEGVVSTNEVDTVTIDLAMTNNAGRILFSPKVVPTAVNQGTVGTNTSNDTGSINSSSDDALAGLEYYGFGIHGLADGEGRTLEDDMVFNGIDGTVDPIVIKVEIPTTHSTAYSNTSSWGEIGLSDVMGDRNDSEDYDDFQGNGAFDDDNNYHQGAISPDGGMIYLGTRNMPVIITYDTTMDFNNEERPQVGRIPLLEDPIEQGYVPSVTMSPDGQFLYATVQVGMHEYYNMDDSQGEANYLRDMMLVKVDATSGEVVSRLSFDDVITEDFPHMVGHGKVKVRDLSINEDGTMGALAIDGFGGIAVISLEGNMSVEKTFDIRAAGYGPRVRAPEINADGSKIYFSDSSEHFSYDIDDEYVSTNDIGIIDVETGDFDKILSTDEITDSVRQLEFGPDGRLYHVGDCSQINVYNVETKVQVATYDESTCYYQLAFDAEGEYLYGFDSSDVEVYKIADDEYVMNESMNSGEAFGLVSPY